MIDIKAIDNWHRGNWCRGDWQSTVNFHLHMKRWLPLLIWGEIYNWCRKDQQSTFTSTWKGNHLCWSWWGINNWCTEDQQSTFTWNGKFKWFNSFFLHVGIKTVYIHHNAWGLMINAERINSQLGGIDDWHREDQQSAFTWNGKFKRFNSFFMHVCIKTVYIHHNAQFWLKKLYTNLSFLVYS